MQLVDTHTHIYLPEFDADRAEVIERAVEEGVSHMVFPGVDASSIALMRKVKEQYPSLVSMAVGVHPTEIGDGDVSFVADELATGQYVAVGEIGLDLHWDASTLDRQMQVFEKQMMMAVDASLPVIIHCREALDPLLEVVDGLEKVPAGVFHSFSGTAAEVDHIRSRGDFYFGLNGVATFKNCRVTDAVPEIGPDRLVLETDAPWLAPVPHRGKRNETAYVVLVNAHIAATQGLEAEELASLTTANAHRLFKFDC